MSDGGEIIAGPWRGEPSLGAPHGFNGDGNTAPSPTSKPSSPAAHILSKAAELVDGERDRQHGDRKVCHTQIARLWTAYLGVKVDPVDVAAMMILVKLGRAQTGNPNPDTWIDICGYGAIAGELSDGPRT